MARPVKIFQAYVENKAGWDFPQATVAIRRVSEASQKTFDSKDCEGNYDESISSHLISYSANFWKDKQTHLSKKPSLPLFNKLPAEQGEEPEFSDVFQVDTEHAQSVQILSTNATPEDKIFSLIEADLIRRFKR